MKTKQSHRKFAMHVATFDEPLDHSDLGVCGVCGRDFVKGACPIHTTVQRPRPQPASTTVNPFRDAMMRNRGISTNQ